MKRKTIQIKRILRNLDEYADDPDSHFDLEKLLANGCLYFQMEDYYFEKDEMGSVSGALRKRTVEVLLNVYQDWQNKLKNHSFDYYLAVWLCLPRLGRSEVVCGIGELIDYYDSDSHLQGNPDKRFPSNSFGALSDRLKALDWKLKVDLDHVSDWEVNFPRENYESAKEYRSDQKRYRRSIGNAVKVVARPEGKLYLFPVGDVWVGV